ncbi:MAG: methyltransferase domain-containing protein [Kiritimatiellae bacterium]|nr:methyltransferase domain-containing protein [Kiritimatiellia bacterium]
MKEKTIGEIVELASAFYGSSVLFAGITCGLFDAVEKLGAEATASALADAMSASERGVRLLADASVALGLLQKNGAVYANTQSGKMALVGGAPADLSKAILYNRDVYPAWGRLADLVRTGECVEAPQLHLGDDAERTRRFALSMRSRAFAIGRGAVELMDLAGAEKLLDLAGGPGAYAELIARKNPNLHVTTLDLPAISRVAAECVAEAGLQERIECVAGDYHTDDFGEGAYDAVTIFGALHQESPEDIASILARAAKALKKGGRVFVLDMMTDATHANPPFSALFAVNMALTAKNGWVFADEELKEWMRAAGLKAQETLTLPPPMPHWMVSAVKEG